MTFRKSLSVKRNRLQAVLSDGQNIYQTSELEVQIALKKQFGKKKNFPLEITL